MQQSTKLPSITRRLRQTRRRSDQSPWRFPWSLRTENLALHKPPQQPQTMQGSQETPQFAIPAPQNANFTNNPHSAQNSSQLIATTGFWLFSLHVPPQSTIPTRPEIVATVISKIDWSCPCFDSDIARNHLHKIRFAIQTICWSSLLGFLPRCHNKTLQSARNHQQPSTRNHNPAPQSTTALKPKS